MNGITAAIPDWVLRSAGISTDGSFDNNFLNKNYFVFTLTRIPNFERFVKEVTVPQMSYGELIQATTLNTDIKYPGGQMRFEPLTIRYAVDERFFTYKELYKWIQNISKIRSPHVVQEEAQTSDATLLILNSAYQAHQRITFKKLYPISLGPLEFSVEEPNSRPVIGSVTFNYTYFEVEDLAYNNQSRESEFI